MQQALWWVLSKSLRKPLTPVITVSGLIRPGQSSPFELREAREAECLVKEQFSAGDETDAVSSTSGQPAISRMYHPKECAPSQE